MEAGWPWLGVLGVMVMPYHLEHWWSRVGAVTPAMSVSFVTQTLFRLLAVLPVVSIGVSGVFRRLC